jgi:hypothetical protein
MWLSLSTFCLAIAICFGVEAIMSANQIRGKSFPG